MALVGEISLDLDSLTLGEMEAAEQASGRSFDSLLTGGKATRKLLAVFLHEYNSFESVPSLPELWRQVKSLRLSDVPFSDSPSLPDGDQVKSGD